jgi:hypothetical protein
MLVIPLGIVIPVRVKHPFGFIKSKSQKAKSGIAVMVLPERSRLTYLFRAPLSTVLMV